MLTSLGLFLIAACFISGSAARTAAVTPLERDYSYVQSNELLATHIQRVLDRLNSLKVTAHPRMRHLYELLKKDIQSEPRERHGQSHHLLDFSRTLRPQYDVNKLNRIFTTEADE